MSPQSGNKTVATSAKVSAFLDKERDAQRRADCDALARLMSDVSGEPAVMWGPSIVGFGSYHYKYESGREGDSLLIGFSPRKGQISVYAMGGVWADPGRLKALGSCTAGGSCLYVKRLADIDQAALRAALAESIVRTRRAYPPAGTSVPAKKVAAKKAAAKKASPKKPAPKKTASKTPATKRAKKSATKSPARSSRS